MSVVQPLLPQSQTLAYARSGRSGLSLAEVQGIGPDFWWRNRKKKQQKVVWQRTRCVCCPFPVGWALQQGSAGELVLLCTTVQLLSLCRFKIEPPHSANPALVSCFGNVYAGVSGAVRWIWWKPLLLSSVSCIFEGGRVWNLLPVSPACVLVRLIWVQREEHGISARRGWMMTEGISDLCKWGQPTELVRLRLSGFFFSHILF